MRLIYQEIEQALIDYKLDIDAAYFHGMLSGLVCAGTEDDDIDDWLPVLITNRCMKQSDYQSFSDEALGLFQTVRADLDQDGFEYEILLPDDHCSLDHRVDRMGSWCRGYLIALIDYAETVVETLPDDCAEFVCDVEQIVDLEIDEDEPDDSLDESYMLLEEHLRVGVQLVFEHMNPLQSD